MEKKKGGTVHEIFTYITKNAIISTLITIIIKGGACSPPCITPALPPSIQSTPNSTLPNNGLFSSIECSGGLHVPTDEEETGWGGFSVSVTLLLMGPR